MNINLDNYEQYLLMYVDNELSAAERRCVEEFLGDYPYLQQELDILQQTVLPLETVSFDKASLLKPMLDESRQEKLLMYLDGELPAGESLVLQNNLATDSNLQKEWDLLQKTKLDAADVILHPDKESLYRRERARIVTGRFVRWAAAAMLIGAGFYGGISLLKDNKTAGTEIAIEVPPVAGERSDESTTGQQNTATAAGNNTASANESTNTGKPQDAPADQPGVTSPVIKGQEAPVRNNMLAVKDKNDQRAANNVVPAPKQKNNLTVDKTNNNDIAVTNQQPGQRISIAEPKELPQRTNDKVLPANDIAAIEKPKNNNSIDLQTTLNTTSKPDFTDRNMSAPQNSFARTAALGLDDNNNQDQVLMMEEENVSRSKAAIFLKKLKRNVERRTNIKPGKSLRIAGFEFAVK